jgi:hypothetical protein
MEIERGLQCPCPSRYGKDQLKRDEERLRELERVRHSGLKLSAHEDIEEAWLTARAAAWSTVPGLVARMRLRELESRLRRRHVSKIVKPLSLREQAELRLLKVAYPKFPPDMDDLFVRANVQLQNHGLEDLFQDVAC